MGDVHFGEQLKAASLRVTVQRIAVLCVLKNNPHIGIASVAYIVRAELGTISLQAVYDILAALTDAKLVRKVGLPGTPALFELNNGDAHQHAMCRRCGNVMDIDGNVDHRLLDNPAAPGFVVEEVEVTLHGLCRSCSASTTGGQSAN